MNFGYMIVDSGGVSSNNMFLLVLGDFRIHHFSNE